MFELYIAYYLSKTNEKFQTCFFFLTALFWFLQQQLGRTDPFSNSFRIIIIYADLNIIHVVANIMNIYIIYIVI